MFVLKIKYFIVVGILIVVNIGSATNILPNGNFNDSNTDGYRPVGWTGGINASTQCISGGIGTGLYWKLECDGTAEQVFIGPDITTTSGEMYTIKGYYQTPSDPGILTIAVVDKNNSDAVIIEQLLPQTQSGWIAFFDEFEAPSTTCRIKLTLTTGNGNIDLDEFSVRPGNILTYSTEFSPQIPAAPAKVFPIYAWVSPEYYPSYPAFTNSDRMHAEFAYANFTIGRDTGFGLKLLLRGNEHNANPPISSSNIWGYMGCDEPTSDEFSGQATLRAEVKTLYPNINYFNNLLPAYAFQSWNDTETYLNSYKTIVQPDVVTFDYYPIQGTSPVYSVDFYPNLELFREVYNPDEIPWGIILQLIGFGGANRSPTYGEMRWQAYSALAYGAKIIAWFTFLSPVDGALAGYDAAIDHDGNRGRHYAMVRAINGEILQLGPILLDLTSTGVFHSLPLPRQTRCYPIDHSQWLEKVENGKALVGEFINPIDDSPYIMVVNRDFVNSAQLKLVFNKNVESVSAVSNIDGQLETATVLTDGSLEISLEAGAGRLFKIKKDNFGLAGWWKLDEVSGSTASDSSEYSHNGTLFENPVWTNGKIGGALSFDGINDYLTVENIDVNTTVGESNTVAFWMKWDGGYTEMPFGWDTGYALLFESNAFGINTGEGNVFGISTAALTAGEWMHVVVVFPNGVPDSTNTKMYINGIQQTLTAQKGSTTNSRTATSKIFLSGWGAGGGYNFGGDIDDFRIYNRELRASEILKLSSLVGHWELNEATGVTASDSSEYSHDGTLVNAPVWTSGKYGGALSFDGIDDYMTIENISVDTSSGASNTVAFWMKWDGGYNEMPFGWNANGGYDLIFAGNAFGINTGQGNVFGISTAGLNVDEWMHVTVVFPNGVPDSSNAKMYINGIQQTMTSQVGATTNSRAATEKIFLSGWNYGGYRFGGDIDDLRIYNRELTASEVMTLVNLVGHWKLDETSGALASDSSDYLHDGTLVNSPVWTSSGKIGGAVSFDGSNNIVIDNVAVNKNPGGANTVAFWMKWNGSYTQMPFGWDGAYDLFFQSNAFGVNTGEGNILGISTSGLSIGEWIHVAVIFPNGVPDTSNTKIYIDGVSQSVTSQLGSTTSSRTATEKIFISGWGINGSYRFDGDIDDFRIYNRALTSNEVADLAAE